MRLPDGILATMDRFEVRRVAEQQWREWREIRLRSLQDTPNAFGSTYERESGFTEAEWRSRLDGSGPAVLAYSGTGPVGMGAGYQDLPGWLHVVAMWTDPAWRGRGVGTAVLRQLVSWAAERGLRVHLDVTVGNDGARAAYERNGFEPTGETRPLREGSPYVVERMILPRDRDPSGPTPLEGDATSRTNPGVAHP